MLHSVYHRPNGWDHVPHGSRDPVRRVEQVGRLPRCARPRCTCGVWRQTQPYLTFFGPEAPT